MKKVLSKFMNATGRTYASVFACALVFLLLGISGAGQIQPTEGTQDGRPRRIQQQQQQQTSTPKQQQTPRPTPTPARRPEPVLGEPPQMPVLRSSPTPTPDPSGEEFDPNETLKINTNLVNLNVRVIDRNNRPIGDVRQDEFRVLEDGVPQPIEFFSKEEVPISYGLAIDTSGSLRSQIDKVIEAGKVLVTNNKQGDETFLERFVDSEHIETVQDFTADRNMLEDALDSLYVEGGQTAVVDGVYLAAEHVAQYKKGDDLSDRRRRALIVVTDGEDRSSYYKQDQLFARLREEDVQIFVIGFVNELEKEGSLIRKSPRDRAISLLDRMAKETGGRTFYPTSISELPKIAQEISRDMRTQYIISYNPTNKSLDGTYRSIKVSVADVPGHEKRIALTRSGRIAAQQGGGKPSAPRPQPARGNNSTPGASPATGARKSP
jgi:Ca-activated chloride channel family protein